MGCVAAGMPHGNGSFAQAKGDADGEGQPMLSRLVYQRVVAPKIPEE
jgi:hypothetical protein